MPVETLPGYKKLVYRDKSMQQQLDEAYAEMAQLVKISNDLRNKNSQLEAQNKKLQQDFNEVWQDFHRCVYLFNENDSYSPLKRMFNKYSEMNAPWKVVDYDTRKDDALTETGTTPY